MNEKRIRRLIKIVEGSDISELEISHWGRKIRISKYAVEDGKATSTTNSNKSIHADSQKQISSPVEQPNDAIPAPPSAESVSAVSEEQSNGHEIRSPMVGTFYRAPSPEAEDYVGVGDEISPGKVLCIIEAMKLMNEIEAEVSGKIVEVLVENGNPVEYNQPLFKVALT